MSESFTGNLLVASSLVDDPIYAGGVCLVVHQDETNVIGVMLNRPMRPSPDALRAMLGKRPDSSPQGKSRIAPYTQEGPDPDRSNPDAEDAGGSDLSLQGQESSEPSDPAKPWRMLHFGGPLSGPVVAIHQISQYAEAETGSGIYVAAQKEHLEDLIRRPTGPYRLIVGHLGWETDQLQSEIDAGIWHLVPATVDTVFSTANEMWPRVIRRATSNSLAKWIGVSDLVDAGELN